MANIYDQVNHYDLMRRLRMLTGYSGIMTAWTGMSYSNQVCRPTRYLELETVVLPMKCRLYVISRAVH